MNIHTACMVYVESSLDFEKNYILLIFTSGPMLYIKIWFNIKKNLIVICPYVSLISWNSKIYNKVLEHFRQEFSKKNSVEKTLQK